MDLGTVMLSEVKQRKTSREDLATDEKRIK